MSVAMSVELGTSTAVDFGDHMREIHDTGAAPKIEDRAIGASCFRNPSIYISCLCYDVSVCLSMMEVNCHIIANLGLKFQSKFTAHCCRGEGSSQQQHLMLC